MYVCINQLSGTEHLEYFALVSYVNARQRRVATAVWPALSIPVMGQVTVTVTDRLCETSGSRALGSYVFSGSQLNYGRLGS